MSGLRDLFGGGNQPTTAPDYTGLQIQTAVNTLPIAIVWGESKIAPNVMITTRKKMLGIGSRPHTIERRTSKASVAFVPV